MISNEFANSDSASIVFVLQAFQQGKEEAYDYFFKHYFSALCFFARTLLPPQHPPEDLVQDCFIRLWEKHWTIKNPNAISPFLYTMVRNACIDLIRKKSVILPIALHEHVTADNAFATWEGNMIRAEVMREIFAVIENFRTELNKL